jgi:hypothetical protein
MPIIIGRGPPTLRRSQGFLAEIQSPKRPDARTILVAAHPGRFQITALSPDRRKAVSR